MKITLKYIILLLFIPLFSFIHIQFGDYSPLSQIPESSKFIRIKEDSSSSSKKRLATVSKHRHINEIKEVFGKRHNKVVNDIENKNFLFDERFNPFFDNVLKEIMEGNELLENENIHLLVSRYPWPNASCLGDGTIIINIGLVSKLENEDQLAFVICHELAHWYLDHVNNDIIKTIEIVNSKQFKRELQKIAKSKYNRHHQYENLMKGIVYDDRRHSRLHETEADSLGFIFYENTRYSIGESAHALQLLETIDQEKYDNPTNFEELFGTENYPFKAEWLKKKNALFGGVKIEKKSKWEIDSLKTHPDCKRRVSLISGMIEGKENDGPPSEMESIRMICDMEIPIYELEMGLLQSSLFHIIQLLEEEKDSPFLETMFLKCMIAIYEKQVGHETILEQDMESDGYEKLNLLFDNISFSELAEMNYSISQKGLLKGYFKEEEYLFLASKAAYYIKRADSFNKLRKTYKTGFPEGQFTEELNSY